MNDVSVGAGDLSGKGVYAARDFRLGEIVLSYKLVPLTFEQLKSLSAEDYAATHTVDGQIYMYPEPARYVNHSDNPNVKNDHKQQADIALRDIKAGEPITVDARHDDVPVLKKINAVLVKVPSIQAGLDFYREQLGLQTLWRTEDTASVRLGDGQLVMSTVLEPETNILVDSVEDAIKVFEKSGGKVVSPSEDIPVGKLATVEDTFGNQLTLLDFSKGFYITDKLGNVTGVSK